jgi:hypothetical protein
LQQKCGLKVLCIFGICNNFNINVKFKKIDSFILFGKLLSKHFYNLLIYIISALAEGLKVKKNRIKIVKGTFINDVTRLGGMLWQICDYKR